MADVVRRIEYYYIVVPNRTGEGAKVLNALKAEGVNLAAFSGFPVSARRAQIDFVPSNRDAFLAAAKRQGSSRWDPKLLS